MKEDRLALEKAVDSGDTDLGDIFHHCIHQILMALYSLSRPVTST